MQSKIPSAITSITLNRATFTNSSINELTFVNFFYGNNGAGKSSVANAIKENDGIVWADGRSAGDLLDKMIVSSSDTTFEKFIKALGTTASDWVSDGHTHYSAAGKCPYCQQKLPAHFEDDIAACFHAQYQQDICDM